MKNLIEKIVRKVIIWLYMITGKLSKLSRRMMITEIGLSGNVSLLDKSLAEEEGLKSLTSFEKWLLEPYIEIFKKEHRGAFEKSCMEVLGEDPNDW